MEEEKFKAGIGSLKSIKEIMSVPEKDFEWNPNYPAIEYHVQFLQDTIKKQEEEISQLKYIISTCSVCTGDLVNLKETHDITI